MGFDNKEADIAKYEGEKLLKKYDCNEK